MTRKALSSINIKSIVEITQNANGNMLSFRNRAGKIIFQVSEDDIFDANGNRFEIDVAFQSEA